MWTHNTAATIRQGAKAGTDSKVLKAKLSLNWTAPFKILAIGPSPAETTPDGRPLASKLLYLDFPNDMPGSDPPVECRWFAASLARTPTTAPTSRDFCPRD